MKGVAVDWGTPSAVRGKVAGSTCCVGGLVPGWGPHPCSTAAIYVVLAELPSLNLSSVSCLLGFLRRRELTWVQCPVQGLQRAAPHLGGHTN